MRRSILDKLRYNSKPIYFRKINITNNESSDLSDYQVCIEINNSNFFEKANLNNILLVENNTVLPYWIEEWKRPSGKAKIWTKLNLKASETKIIYLYYGDNFNVFPNGDDVFLFFDDFDENNLNIDKWNLNLANGSYAIIDSKLTFFDDNDSDNWPKVYTDNIFPNYNVILESKCGALQTPDIFMAGVYILYRYTNEDIYSAIGRGNNQKKFYSAFSWGSLTEINAGIYKNVKLKIEYLQNQQKCYGFDDEWHLITTYSNSISDNLKKIELTLHARNGNNEGFFDWVLLRKYTANEPTISVESEQQKLIDNYDGVIIINSFNGYFTHYKRSIQITNNESSALNNFQIPIEIDGDFLDKADPNNLIFMDGSTILSYWIEEWGRFSGKAKIWIKTNLTASQTKTIYLYYGGYVSQKPNGDNVFEFFDDFPGTSLDSNKWAVIYEVGGGYHSVSNSKLIVGSTDNDWSMVGAKSQYSYGHAFEFLASMTEQNNSNIVVVTRSGTTADWDDMGSIMNDGSQRYVTKSGGAQDTHSRSDNISSMKRLTIAYISGHMKYYIDGSLKYDCTNHVPIDKNLGIQFRNAANGSQTVIDWVAVRKYTTNEPSVSVGNESNELRYW